MSWQDKTATVFGGHGFIGRYLVHRLARAGASVRVASRHPSQATFLKTAGAVGQIVPVAVDIAEDESVAAAVAGAHIVVNLIGILYESGRWTFDLVHTEAPRRIAAAARAAGTERLVHISAIGADPQSEADYARTKGVGEQAVMEAFPTATLLRPSIVFGPEDNFFNMFAGMAMISPALPLVGGGETRFQPVYVADVADAIMAALEDPETAGKTYELGGPKVYTFKELMKLLVSEIRRKRFLVPIPWGVARLQGAVFERLPKPLLTRDQVRLLHYDNVVGDSALTLQDLGISPRAVEVILPTYMGRFRPGGRFSRSKTA